MWCWHRIRESESGLCPACRTPYGDDPHEFSAVDVEEVLKANKEKEAAEKRARSTQRNSNNNSSSSGGAGGTGAGGNFDNHSGNNGEEFESIAALTGGQSKGPMEIPKDRNQLANMRVIRRNLVYAVGLPPNIASEDMLRKPDYFGQYGKINKIVLNRSQTTTPDPRRASASAYVTFFHKVRSVCLLCVALVRGICHQASAIRPPGRTETVHSLMNFSIQSLETNLCLTLLILLSYLILSYNLTLLT